MSRGAVIAAAAFVAMLLTVSFVFTAMPPPWSQRGLYLWYVVAAVAGLLLLGAGVAKVIKIGVRSARDGDSP